MNTTSDGAGKQIEQNGGVWNRLYSERQDVCEALLREPTSSSEDSLQLEATIVANWHRQLLQERLRKIDDALDRLVSGSYGNCCRCGKWIEDTKLDFDPAIAFCLECWPRMRMN